ncbi:MAG: hypothetical protein D6816_00630 [Bacteroidetes bacterium]|nr:MAG: hypothetical protein D6816_00630 [Bacteroidota bacterium]
MTEETKDKFEKWLRSPWYAVFVTLALVFVGFWGSAYGEEIRQAFPFYWGQGNLSWPALVFWIALAATAFLFWSQRWAIDRARKRGEERVEEYVTELSEIIRTMPPRNFLNLFGTIYRQCENLTWSALNGGSTRNRDDLIKAIRGVLYGYAKLAEAFSHDGNGDQVPCSANVMVYFPSSSLNDEQRSKLQKMLIMCDSTTCIERLKGVLLLRTDLSACTKKQPGEEDDELVSIALPVPREIRITIKRGRRQVWKVLPGAPKAFALKETDFYVNSTQLLKWCSENGDFTEEVKQHIEDYFQNPATPTVGSFIASHLSKGEGDDEDPAEVPLGVVNIHRRESGILKNREEAMRSFVSISRPLRLMLYRLLECLKTNENAQFGGWYIVNPDDPDAKFATVPHSR